VGINMTTSYSIMSKEDMVKEFLRPSREKKLRARFPMVPGVHFCIAASVAIYCLNMVR
jgi:hypothetical protein